MEDKCLLLFAAWNALGKFCGIDPQTWTGPSTMEEFKGIAQSSKLIRIRNDVCNLCQELKVCEKTGPDTLLTLQLKKKEDQRDGKGSIGSKGVAQLSNTF